MVMYTVVVVMVVDGCPKSGSLRRATVLVVVVVAIHARRN